MDSRQKYNATAGEDDPGEDRGQSADAGFGVYVHWPFCSSKCPYCDFNSHVRAGGIDEGRFLAGYLKEIEATARRIGQRQTVSVFFGGGTPSLMSAASVGDILERIDRCWPIAEHAEITLEANPGSVEAARFAGYRAAGVNRVSLGVQSLHDDVLRSLGRLHSAEEARAAISIARRTFSRFSFDLIYARPGQSVAAWQEELRAALDLAGSHLSLYQLTIEDGTPFAALHASGKLVVPDDDRAAELFAITQQMTAAAGLSAYEISNHASPGEESRHNLLYWRYGEYAGIGAGAHGRLLDDGVRYATAAERMPERWLDRIEAGGLALVENQPLRAEEIADEALLMGLRLVEGIDLDQLATVSGMRVPPAGIGKLVDDGLIERVGAGRIRAANAARFVLNEIVLRLSAALVQEGARECQA